MTPPPTLSLDDLYRRLLLPEEITGSVLAKAVRTAFRLRVWWRLDPLKRGLLLAASRVVDRVRSPVLRELLEEVLLEVYRWTLKGRALYYGLIIALRGLRHLGERVLGDVETLLYLGISYLSNPPLYRTL